jgi:hypothetical protein
MNGSAAAKRFPRERFNRSLARLFARLDDVANAEFDVANKPGETPRISGRVRARVRRLWAVGSFARGAPMCLDCDLVVEGEASWVASPSISGGCDEPWSAPPSWDLYGRQLLGPALPHVRVMSLYRAESAHVDDEPGGPLRRTFNMGTAVLLYGDGVDWRKALASIEVDARAGHFPRYYDALPLRLDQTGLSPEDASRLLDAEAAGLLSWSVQPLERIAASSSVLTPQELHALAAFELSGASKKAMDVAAAAVIATRAVRGKRRILLKSERGAHLSGGAGEAVVYRFGRQRVEVGDFAAPLCHAIVLVPYWTQVGPNRAWVLKRGPKFGRS